MFLFHEDYREGNDYVENEKKMFRILSEKNQNFNSKTQFAYRWKELNFRTCLKILR